MIEKHHSLQRAEAILTIMNELIGSDLIEDMRKENISLWIECFDNCREQGYSLVVYGLKETLHIAFTESRNSDSTRVYEYHDVSFPSNLPSENNKCWTEHKTFGYNEHYQCAEYIIKRLKKFLQDSKYKGDKKCQS